MITLDNVTKSFKSHSGSVIALDSVTLEIPAGTIAGVVGPSGSGKSTLARLLSLQERPDSGVIRLDGLNIAALDPRRLRAARGRIGVVPPGESLLEQRTAAGNIAAPLEQAGMDGPQRRQRVGRLLDLVGLTDKAATYPEALSPGQRRRVAVARALVAEPTVLLADDPTASLDPDGTAGVLTVLDRARAELGTTVLVATSDTSVARRIADDVALLDHGRVVESGHLLELATAPDSLVARAILPTLEPLSPAIAAVHDWVGEVILIGFAAVGALLPETSSRFGVDVSVLGGGITRIGETPVARFRLGVSGDGAESALAWVADRGGLVRRAATGPRSVAA